MALYLYPGKGLSLFAVAVSRHAMQAQQSRERVLATPHQRLFEDGRQPIGQRVDVRRTSRSWRGERHMCAQTAGRSIRGGEV